MTHQPNLFEPLELARLPGVSAVPLPAPALTPKPSPLKRARRQRDAAMATIERKTASDMPGFAERARAFVLRWLVEKGATSGEQITAACVEAGIEPKDLRGFGPVYYSLSRRGLIVKAGTCQRVRGHLTAGGIIWAVTELGRQELASTGKS